MISHSVVSPTGCRPYGEEVVLAQPLTLPETKGFIGERFDDASGLQYLNARYYDPKLGLFRPGGRGQASIDRAREFAQFKDVLRSAVYVQGSFPIPGVPGVPPIITPEYAQQLGNTITSFISERIFVTYTLQNQAGAVYVGRTSGYGLPTDIMMTRYAGHTFRRLQGYSNPTLDQSAVGEAGYLAIRGREQQLIDHYGGIGSPSVGNYIRGVARSNPFGRVYQNAADAEFGNLHSYTGY